MATTLKKSKLDAVIDHLQTGGDEALVTVAAVADIDEDDTETAAAYLRKAKKDIAAAVPVTKAPESDAYQLKDATGVLRDLEVVKQKGNRLILQLPVERDLVSVLVKGMAETVDLEELRRLGPDEFHLGVKVSTLIAAAELAKG